MHLKYKTDPLVVVVLVPNITVDSEVSSGQWCQQKFHFKRFVEWYCKTSAHKAGTVYMAEYC